MEMIENLPIQHDPGKRLFDIAFSFLVLFSLSPLFLIIALLIRCTSRGPVFYRSRRLGRGARPIECLKFRTMVFDAEIKLLELLQKDSTLGKEWKLYQKFKADPRITPIGKILRKTSLDELPQFWNVLKGDLSIVGPRPATLIGNPENSWKEILDLYGSDAISILSVRPGITGVWQISGRSNIPFSERKKMESIYVVSRTFWTDLIVIAKTIPAVLFSKGAI